MANFCFCVNHAWNRSTGGCETIVQQLAEMIVKKGHSCRILATNMNGQPILVQENMAIQGSGLTPQNFLDIVDSTKTDHLFVYSDLFTYWPTIVQNSKKLNCHKYIVLVGMNKMLTDKPLFNLFFEKRQEFITIAHSEYIDYLTCYNKGISPLVVIPLSINLSEFKFKENIDFRKKYGIKNQNMLLCVANFYPGKGHEFLPRILRKAFDDFPDFEVVFISSKINASFAQIISNQLDALMKRTKVPYKILQGIPREDVIQAFYESTLFLCQSQKEVGPIVLLEAMAASKPWISLAVGHHDLLSGGVVIDAPVKDKNGNFTYTNSVYEDFSYHICHLLRHKEKCQNLGIDGRKRIEEYFSWDKVASRYEGLFEI